MHYRRYHCEGIVSSGPVVYVCRHRYAIGPVTSLCCLPVGVRPWVLSTFFDVNECKKHCIDYTFTVSWGVPKRLARGMAQVISPAFTALVHSVAGVPVYRHSLKVRETFAQSVRALEAGDSLLIFPDVDYAAEDSQTGQLYEGFLMLEQLWFRKTREHVRFVPLHISKSGKRVVAGEPVVFSGARPFNEEKHDVAACLASIFDGMTKEYGA